jgi:hypothetical protein
MEDSIHLSKQMGLIALTDVSFDEKIHPEHAEPEVLLTWWARSLSTDVSGQSLKLLTSMNGL